MYYYDTYGWLTNQPITGRSTDAVPPIETATLKANWTGLEWVLVEYTAPPEPTPVVIPRTPISKREFLKLFTPDEYSAIKNAAAVNSTLDYYWQQFMLAEFIALDDPDTIVGINMLQAIGLLTTERAAEILA